MTIRLNKDGSGTLTEETTFGSKAVEMLAQLAQMGAGAGDPLADLASPAKAKDRAAKLGEGVTVEKTEKISTNEGGKGGRAVYRFADINKLTFSPGDSAKSAIPSMPGAQAPVAEEAAPVVFRYAGDKLTISIPEPEKAEVPAGESPLDEAALEDPQAQAAMMEMAEGGKVSFKIIIEPGISESNATYVDGNTITVSEIEFEKLMANPESLKKMSKLSRDPVAALEAMKAIEGVKVESKRELTVSVK